MEAYHRQPLPPTGASHALSVRLTQDSYSPSSTVISHLITARDSLIQVWEVREHDQAEGETTATLHHLLTRRLHGTITSLARVRTLASKSDGADRVLISFLDAKMSLMEWTPSAHELLPISLHTFEKLPQVTEGLAKSAVDPASRLAVLLLPSNTGGDGTLAILPFFQEEIDLDALGVDAESWAPGGMASLPYAPSHILPLSALSSNNASLVSTTRSSTLNNATSSALKSAPPVRNVIDMVFLPGFNEPTLALLYAPEPTWVGRLESVSSNCLVSLVTLATGSAPTGASSSTTAANATTAVVIATSPELPHSCLSIHPCPPDLGGTLIITGNGVLHLEQGGKIIGTPANAWFGTEWTGPGSATKGATEATTVGEGLEGAKLVFIANHTAMIFCKTGMVLELTIRTSGRAVVSMELEKVGKGISASCTERIRGSKGRFGERGYVFVGSEVGESTLLSWQIGNGEERIEEKVVEMKVEVTNPGGDEMDFDDEEDLYGSSTVVSKSSLYLTESETTASRALTLRTCDVIDAYGGIRSLAMGLVHDESPAELVACTGGGVTAGFTIFHRTLAPRKRRKLELAHLATHGLWSLALGASAEEKENIRISSNHESTKIVSQAGGASSFDVTIDEATITAGSVLLGSALIRVSATQIQLLDHDLGPLHTIDLDVSFEVVRAIISDPYVAVIGKGAAQLFVVNPESRQIEAREIPERVTNTLSSMSIFLDVQKTAPMLKPAPVAVAVAAKANPAEEEEDDLYATAPRRALASDVNLTESRVVEPTFDLGASPTPEGASAAWHWAAFVDQKGRLEILLLPSMEVIFTVSSVSLFPDVLEDGLDVEIPEDIDEDDVEIDRISCVGIGESTLRPHLLILLTNGSFAAYEAFPTVTSTSDTSRPISLGVRFVKTLTRRLPVMMARRPRPGVAEDELPPARREFVSFAKFGRYSGVFATGEDPFWLIATDHGPVRHFEHSERGVYAFATTEFDHDGSNFVVQTKTGASVASLPDDVCFDRELPCTRLPRDRRYGSFTFDLDSGLYVAGALFDTVFMNFDDEGNPVFVNESPDMVEPTNYRSSLELIVPGTWEAIHGFEFRPNEFISTVKSVSLTSRSKASGRKDFIAVGTTVHRAEDLAARGGIYVFEVVKIVPLPATPHHNHQLKLLFFEDTKSVVGNVCDLDGYLVMSMGQKLYVRAFEQDEVLLAVGFLDVGVHVTSLQTMKNFLLIGDALQSVTLVAFQEDPYKLVLLGRDYRLSRTASANFLVNDGKVAFVTGDLDGVLRLFEYDPTNIASHAGQRLMLRTEYHAGAEAGGTLLYTKRVGTEEIKQNGILFGGIDGSLYLLVPVREAVFKRLQLLQAVLTRHIQHFGGLNPRGYRIVKNDSVSRAINKGILDGELLAKFEWLPLDRQIELTAHIGTDPDTVLLNLKNLQW